MLSPEARRFLDAPNFAALATAGDGRPSCHMMWVDADEDFVYLNTEVHRRKFHRMPIGAAVAVMVFEHSRSWIELEATVVSHEVGVRAREHLDRLARKYNGRPYAKHIESERVVVKLRPDREFLYLPSTERSADDPVWR